MSNIYLTSSFLNAPSVTCCSQRPPREEHEFQVCADKPVQGRSFSWKNYLWQHLHKVHSCTKALVTDLETWRGSGTDVESCCGFCGCSLSTWSARAEHLADHFKKGFRMNQWEGD
ncbi:hypothetical protein PDIG_87450 [Penicillium digitatum PHI26]|uniref:C2H2-type domain-containing protein n=2 Tax=Penicillium digitatum TaxID=36651 RepID=K9FPU2_PEND2|nr:hypothetical protein PDIP_33480 [Penicillium digitatum Pd1]EKV04753.1 hypothetical protein PDIG_87450 [Penicillium digitatum PHI26]EKV16981.1 hypothetical protein PDIP_33480 [Penicillium digitatum Pd1]